MASYWTTNEKEELCLYSIGQKFVFEALTVPGMKHNLLSSSKIASRGAKIVTDKLGTTVYIKNNPVLFFKPKNCLYYFEADRFNEQCFCSCR